MRRLFLLLGCAAMLSSPASAQDELERLQRNDDMQTGSRFKRAPETADTAQRRVMQKDVARCVVYRNKDLSRDLLAKSDTARIDFDAVGIARSELFDELNVGDCLGRAAKRNTLSILMRIPYRTLRNLMAEEVYLMDQREPLILSENAPAEITDRFYAPGNSRGAEMSAQLSDCIVRQSPVQAHELIEARPGSKREGEALDGLFAALVDCGGEGIADAEIDMSSIRMVVADGLWARMHYGRPASANNSEAAE